MTKSTKQPEFIGWVPGPGTEPMRAVFGAGADFVVCTENVLRDVASNPAKETVLVPPECQIRAALSTLDFMRR